MGDLLCTGVTTFAYDEHIRALGLHESMRMLITSGESVIVVRSALQMAAHLNASHICRWYWVAQ